MAEPIPLNAADDAVILLDLGRKKRKSIKRLLKGGGPLTDTVRDAVVELRTDGSIPATGPVVVVVVREKRKKTFGLY